MAATIEAPEKLVGKPIRRREDPKLMTGDGNFLDDIRLPGMAYANDPVAAVWGHRLGWTPGSFTPALVLRLRPRRR